MDELLDLLAGRNENVSLDVAALQLATIEYPDLEAAPYIALLDSHAAELGERVDDATGGEDFVRLLNDYMVDELGFRGNEKDYYCASNSCLNTVLTERTGIPISLAVLYMEVGRRLERPVFGIGLPGHFLVQYDDGEFSAFIDPFNSGRLLFEQECLELAKQVIGYDVSSDSSVLLPVSKRHIAIRMLNNLRAVYFKQQNPQKTSAVLDLLITAEPSAAEAYKHRGLCRSQMELFKGARSDFETYLRLEPEAYDRTEVEAQIERLKRWLARLH
ncbi:MAG: transglutaminase-like domain-containing protein [Bryobacteraceae bacterium]